MPFTLSHMAAVLPFSRTRMAPAALAIGSMAPDIPYFLPGDISRDLTHSLLGGVSIDLVFGIAAVAAWLFVLRRPVLDYAPAWVRERMTSEARWRARTWWSTAILTLVALELGILTHLLLDEITHEGGWLDSAAPWFGVARGPISVANLIHALVSIGMAVIVAVWVLGWTRRTPREPRATRLVRGERAITAVLICLVLAAAGMARWVFFVRLGRIPYDPDVVARGFFLGASAAAAVSLVLALSWHLRKQR